MNSSVISSSSDIKSVESLNSEQQKIIEKFCSGSNQSGVVVGAKIGKGAWDIRPILMDKGSLNICRLTDPNLSLDSNMFQGFCNLYDRLKQINQDFKFGHYDGQAWYRRPYYDQVLDSSTIAGMGIHPLKLIRRLIQQRLDQAKLNIIHGHISTNNLVLANNEFILVDYGFRGWSANSYPTVNTVAPELYKKFPPTPVVDIYGLGVVMSSLLGEVLSLDHLKMIQNMCSENPDTRPMLEEVSNIFLPAGNLAHEVKVVKRPFVPNELRSGKLINPQLIKQPQTILEPSQPIQHIVQPKPPPAPEPPKPPPMPDPEPVPTRSPVYVQPQVVPERQSSGGMFWFFAVILLAGLVWYANENGTLDYWLEKIKQEEVDYAAYWDSGQPSLMSTVAKKAIKDPSSRAAEVIILSIGSLSDVKEVQEGLLELAFHPAWRTELNEDDKRVALTLGLAPLLIGEAPKMPSFNELHPGVVLAIAAKIPVEQRNSQLDAVAISNLAELPDEYGVVFQLLQNIGVKSLKYSVARVLCHFVAGASNQNLIKVFFSNARNQEDIAQKILIIVPLFNLNPNLAEGVLKYFNTNKAVKLRTLDWLEANAEPLANWGKVLPADKLRLAVGADVQSTLEFEQTVDLLTFPLMSVRRKAERTMAEAIPEDFFPIVSILGSKENLLSREQTISLMAALRLKPESQHPYLSEWFNTNPDVSTVVKLIVARRNAKNFDPFSLEASRYIKDKEWDLSLSQLEKLLLHPEALVRVLAYGKLDPAIPEELAVLKSMAEVEPDETIREQLQKKVQSFE